MPSDWHPLLILLAPASNPVCTRFYLEVDLGKSMTYDDLAATVRNGVEYSAASPTALALRWSTRSEIDPEIDSNDGAPCFARARTAASKQIDARPRGGPDADRMRPWDSASCSSPRSGAPQLVGAPRPSPSSQRQEGGRAAPPRRFRGSP